MITTDNTLDRKFITYIIVGIVNNALGYLIYLLITWLWLEPKLAVTLMYPISAATAYFGHAKFSFGYEGPNLQGITRYVIAHLIGYSSNIALLYFLHDLYGLPHQLVQLLAIAVVAIILYLLFRYFVFRSSPQRPDNL